MITSVSLPFLADQLFQGLVGITLIRTTGPETGGGEALPGESRLRLASVGGDATPEAYKNHLLHLQALFLTGLSDLAGQVAPGDAWVLAGLVDRRFRLAARAVVREERGSVAWNQACLQVEYNGHEAKDRHVVESAAVQSRRFAIVYAVVLARMREQARLAALCPRPVAPSATTGVAGTPVRFRLNGTVTLLGAMLRVAYERDLIHEPVVSELCRRFAAMFSTGRQEEISPKSLRNAFDDPRPETLETLLAEMQSACRFLEKFIERQRR